MGLAERLKKLPLMIRDYRGPLIKAAPPAAVFAAAFILRFLYIHQFKGDPFLDCLFLDPLYYSDQAKAIVGGDPLGGSDVFEMSPLYPYFLAFIYKFITTDLFFVRLVQILIGSTSCVIIFAIARGLFKSEVAALAAGLIAAAYGPFIFYDGVIMKTGLAVFFILLTALTLIRSERSGLAAALLSGVFLGLAALVRGNTILLLPVVPLWFFFLKEYPLKTRALKGGFFVLGFCLMVLPVTLRNYYVGGEFVLITSGGGEVFYIGNNPEADGSYKIPAYVDPRPRSEHEDFRRRAEELTNRELTRAESSRYWFARGLKYIAEDPLDYLRLESRKFLLFWNFYEYPDNHNYYLHRANSRVLGGPVLNFSTIAPLAMLGLVLAFGAARRYAVLYLVFFAYLASFMLFFNFARFRLPAVPFLIIFAVYAVLSLVDMVKQRRFKHALVSLCALAAFYMITTMDMHDKDPYRFLFDTTYANLGLCYEKAGSDARAVEYFNKALDIKDAHPVSLKALGRIYTRRSRYDLAEKAYTRLIKADPQAADPHKWLGDTYRARGKTLLAIREYEQAIALDPDDHVYYADLGFALVDKGMSREAIDEFARALLIAPDSTRNLYGMSLAEKNLEQGKK